MNVIVTFLEDGLVGLDDWSSGSFMSAVNWTMSAAAAAFPLAVVVALLNVFCRRWFNAGQLCLLWSLVCLRLVLPWSPSSPMRGYPRSVCPANVLAS